MPIDFSSLFHESESRFSYPIDEHHAHIVLLTKKGDPALKKVSLIYQCKYRGEKSQVKVEMPYSYSDALHDYYEIDLELYDVRIIYAFELIDDKGDAYYFSEAGVDTSLSMGQTCYNVFQIPYINSSDIIRVNEKFADRVFYQIFPDRFARDDSVPHSKHLIKWGDKINMLSFAGGNLKGIESKLSYLSSLGIGAIYLNPVWKGSTNHKYDTLEYGAVDPDFGTDEDLIHLVDACHKADILMVLDIVYNHLSYLHPFFQDVVKKGKKSKYYNWFIIRGDYPSFKDANYEAFGIHPYMPKINLNDEECSDYFIQLSLDMIKKYHVDGFRLDVSDEVPHSFWRKLNIAIKREYPDFLLIGENWHHAESFLNNGDQFESVMNYAVTRLALGYFANKEFDAKRMADEIYGSLSRYKKPINHNLLNLIGSHDKKRFLNETKGNRKSFLSAYLFLIMYPGLPSIYYGDEIGMAGDNDPDCRGCFAWDEKEQDKEILDYFKKIIAIRNSFPLSKAAMRVHEEKGLLVIDYTLNDEVLSLYFNNQKTGVEVPQEGEILSLEYHDGILQKDGFLVRKIEKGKGNA